MIHETFHDMYAAAVRSLVDEPAHRNAPRGFDSAERIGEQYRLRDAVQRVPTIPARRLNIVFNHAEALWYLSGRDDLAFVEYYAPRMRRYSADGVRLTGTAYGRSLFGGDGRPNQWRNVVDQLRADPSSKRAVLSIFDRSELGIPANPDVSCTLGLQFLVRDGRLHTVGFMRANDVYRGMASDVFSFTFLQEVLARELGLDAGGYTHSVGSVHLYDPDAERAAELLADPAASAPPVHRTQPMPDGDNWPWIREVLRYEEALRLNRHRVRAHDDLGLPGYWAQVVLLFELFRSQYRDEPVDGDVLDALSPLHRWLVGHWRPSALAADPAAVRS